MILDSMSRVTCDMRATVLLLQFHWQLFANNRPNGGEQKSNAKINLAINCQYLNQYLAQPLAGNCQGSKSLENISLKL